MIIYFFTLLLVSVITLWLLFRYSSKRKDNIGFREHFQWAKAIKVWLIALFATLFILVTLCFFVPIKKTLNCAYKGYEHSVETQYFMFSGNCNYKGSNGEWIPISRLMGIADGTTEG